MKTLGRIGLAVCGWVLTLSAPATVLVISATLTFGAAAQQGTTMRTQTPEKNTMQNSSLEKKKASLPGFDDAVADSLTGFGDTQGASGWHYGWTEKNPAGDGAPVALRRLEQSDAGWWRHDDSLPPGISADTFETSPGLIPVRRWTPRERGSVRIVGTVQKLSSKTEADFRVLVDGRTIWNRQFAREDSIRHGVDILALDLTSESLVDFCVVAGPDSQRVKVKTAFQIVPEPFVSRWRPDLPAGFPMFAEEEKKALRKKGQEILQEIRDASNAKQERIVIPPGDYLFHANWHRDSTLENLADLGIDAHSATFWFEPPHINALLLKDCHNVTVRGLTIDFTSPIWFQARVSDVDRKKGTIQANLMDGYAPRDAKGDKETSGNRALMFYDAEGRFINHRHSPGMWQLSEDGAGVLCTEIRRHGIPDALQPGDYVVGTIRTGAAMRLSHCSDMVFEDVNIWSSPGVAINNHMGGGGHVYRRVRATRRPRTNRLHAFGADVFHFAQQDRGPVLDRCESAYSADDNLNIHGGFGRVVKRVDDHRYYLQGAYDEADTLEFRDMESVQLLGMAKVVSVIKTPDGPSLAINAKYRAKGEFLVELGQPLELPALSLVVMDGKRSCQGWIVRNSWFHDNFQRTLINGAPGGLIENTTLQNVGMGVCIQFETWGPWMEGPFARDLVIRGNRFLDCPPEGPVISVSMHPPGGGTNARRREAKPVTNMTIAGNTFAQTAGMPVDIHNVDGLKIHGNSIDRSPRAPATPSDWIKRHLLRRDDGWARNPTDLNWLYLQDCSHVSIRENQTPGMSRSEE